MKVHAERWIYRQNGVWLDGFEWRGDFPLDMGEGGISFLIISQESADAPRRTTLLPTEEFADCHVGGYVK